MLDQGGVGRKGLTVAFHVQLNLRSRRQLGDGEQIRSNTVVVENTPPEAPEVEVIFEEGCRSLQLDGINDWIELGSMGALEDFTAEAWVRPGSTSLEGRVVDYDGGSGAPRFFLGSRTDGMVEVEVGRADPAEQLSLVSTTVITDDRWHHVAAVRESGTGTPTVRSGYDEENVALRSVSGWDAATANQLVRNFGRVGSRAASRRQPRDASS